MRLVPRGDGATAWHDLVHEYEPNEASRHCAVLAGFVGPEWRADVAFLDQLLVWEKKVSDYEATTEALIPDRFKCAIVMRWAPKAVKDMLRLMREDRAQNYGRLRAALQTFQARGRPYDGTSVAHLPGGLLPMEVDAVQTKGKGKTRACFGCGSQTHLRRDCPNPRQQQQRQQQQNTKTCKGCGRTGHVVAECRTTAARAAKAAGKGGQGGGKGSGTPGAKGAGKGKGAPFTGECYKCGTPGHRAADCRRVLALEDGEEAQESDNLEESPPCVFEIDGKRSDVEEELLCCSLTRGPTLTCARQGSPSTS